MDVRRTANDWITMRARSFRYLTMAATITLTGRNEREGKRIVVFKKYLKEKSVFRYLMS